MEALLRFRVKRAIVLEVVCIPMSPGAPIIEYWGRGVLVIVVIGIAVQVLGGSTWPKSPST